MVLPEHTTDLAEQSKGIGLIILAAGGSARMGTAKQLLAFQGETLLRRAVHTALESYCQPVYVVLGANASALRSELEGLPVRCIDNPQWMDGMASSIVCGLKALLQDVKDVSAVVLMLCDQPLLTADRIRSLIRVYRESASSIVASGYPDGAGVPALFDRSLFPELLELLGAQGAKRVIARHPDRVVVLPALDSLIDLDTAEDYQRLLEISDGTG